MNLVRLFGQEIVLHQALHQVVQINPERHSYDSINSIKLFINSFYFLLLLLIIWIKLIVLAKQKNLWAFPKNSFSKKSINNVFNAITDGMVSKIKWKKREDIGRGSTFNISGLDTFNTFLDISRSRFLDCIRALFTRWNTLKMRQLFDRDLTSLCSM